jgi:hypothetical protein
VSFGLGLLKRWYANLEFWEHVLVEVQLVHAMIEQDLRNLALCSGNRFAVYWASYPIKVHSYWVDQIPLVDAGVCTDHVGMRLTLVETARHIIGVLQDAFMREECLDVPEVFELFQLGGTKDDGRFVHDLIDRVRVGINLNGSRMIHSNCFVSMTTIPSWINHVCGAKFN